MTQLDKLTQYLISNGDVPAWMNQQIYEYAWSEGIRPLREDRLKPQGQLRRKRREPRHKAAWANGEDCWWDWTGLRTSNASQTAVMAE